MRVFGRNLPVGADISVWWGIEENCATSFLWGCRIMKGSIFKTFLGSNVRRRQRREKPCEEVEPERREPKVCCASKSLLMGHGGPLIPVWLFLSLPHRKTRSFYFRFPLSIPKYFPQKEFSPTQDCRRQPAALKTADLSVWITQQTGNTMAGSAGPWRSYRRLLSCGQLQPSASFGDGVLQPRGN